PSSSPSSSPRLLALSRRILIRRRQVPGLPPFLFGYLRELNRWDDPGLPVLSTKKRFSKPRPVNGDRSGRCRALEVPALTHRSTFFPGLSRRRLLPASIKRQSYSRVAKVAAMMAGRYAHAKQFVASAAVAYPAQPAGSGHSRHPPQDRGPASLEEVFARPLGRAAQIRSQQQRQR